MEHVYPAQWNAFCQKVHPGIKLPCPQTEFYPQFGNAKLESGSNAVSVFVTSSYGEGAIGYDEYRFFDNDSEGTPLLPASRAVKCDSSSAPGRRVSTAR